MVNDGEKVVELKAIQGGRVTLMVWQEEQEVEKQQEEEQEEEEEE